MEPCQQHEATNKGIKQLNQANSLSLLIFKLDGLNLYQDSSWYLKRSHDKICMALIIREAIRTSRFKDRRI
jgi:hypothetical protein